MKISAFIRELEKMKNKRGDMEVTMWSNSPLNAGYKEAHCRIVGEGLPFCKTQVLIYMEEEESKEDECGTY